VWPVLYLRLKISNVKKAMPESTIITLDIGASYILDLPGLGNCGYTWVCDVNKENNVKILHQYIVPPNPKPGERGIERFTISGVRHGSCVIEFRQIHSWEKAQPPLDSRRVQVNVG
jgi:predicted secreted protein